MSSEIALTGNQSFMEMIERVSTSKDIDPAKLSALLDFQERLEARSAEKEFNEAFLRLREKLPVIKKGDVVEYPVNKNDPNGPKKEAFKFAKWEKVQALIDDIIRQEGFDLTFDSEVHPNGSSVIAILHHVGGHTRRTSTPPIPIDSGGGKNNVQGVGSSMSYGQRYATKFALNLRFEDDDDGRLAGVTFINSEQVKVINALVAETKIDMDRFLQTLGAASVENIPTQVYPLAHNMLASKAKKGAA